MKRKYILLIFVLFVFCLTGCTIKQKEFSGCGTTISLSSDFKEYPSAKWSYYVENDRIAYMVNRKAKTETINGTPIGSFTLKQYMGINLSNAQIEADVYYVEGVNGDFYYCYYTTGTLYGYMFMVMESESYFYVINLATDYATFQDDKKILFSYAVTITVE